MQVDSATLVAPKQTPFEFHGYELNVVRRLRVCHDGFKDMKKLSRKQKQPRILITAQVKKSVPLRERRSALLRHVPGDWGELSEEDRKETDRWFASGQRVQSAHTARNGTRFWILTEPDRSETIIMLPEEYPKVYEFPFDD